LIIVVHMEAHIVALSVMAASAIGIAIITYVKLLKKRMKRFVLRYEKIEKYFKEERK